MVISLSLFIFNFYYPLFCLINPAYTKVKEKTNRLKTKTFITNKFLLQNIELFLYFSLFTNKNFDKIKLIFLKTNFKKEKKK